MTFLRCKCLHAITAAPAIPNPHHVVVRPVEQTVKGKESDLKVELTTLQRTRSRLMRNLKTIPVKISEREFHAEVRELTTQLADLSKSQDDLRRAGIRVSVFIDPDALRVKPRPQRSPAARPRRAAPPTGEERAQSASPVHGSRTTSEGPPSHPLAHTCAMCHKPQPARP